MKETGQSLYERLCEYAGEGCYPFHMPGHKRNGELFLQYEDSRKPGCRSEGESDGRTGDGPAARPAAVEIPYGIDITEIEGFDNLHQPEGILKESMERAAELYGADETFYLVGGSTCGLLAGISACTEPGDRILMARNCHKAVYHAVYLRGLRPVYLYPETEEEFGICGGIRPGSVRAALKRYPDIRIVVITSPTYEGVVSKVSEIADIAHEKDIPLLIDEAHGAHFGFGFGFPDSSVHQGADLVIHSVHKTLPSPTQTALLHWREGFVPRERVKQFLGMYQSSSPSYILMAGIDRCLELLGKHGSEIFSAWQKRLCGFYREVRNLKRIRVFCGNRAVWEECKCTEKCAESGVEQRKAGRAGKDMSGEAEIADTDPSKLVISVKGTGYSGEWLYHRLVQDYRLMPEMVSGDYIICMTGPGDTAEGMQRLSAALHELDGILSGADPEQEPARSGGVSELAETSGPDPEHSVQEPYRIEAEQTAAATAVTEEYSWQAQARGRRYERVLLADSEGCVSAEYVWLYPPGIPLLVPGERVTKELLAALSAYRRSGLSLKGMSDDTGDTILICRPER